MIGKTLSRWTMTYFASAVGFLLVAQVLMVCGYGFPADAIAAPASLILVHCLVVGWLSLLMIGALLQFVPVLVVRPLCWERLVAPALISILTGLLALLGGFALLGDAAGVSPLLLATASLLLPGGLLLAILPLLRTLWAARPLPLPARFVAVGLISLLVTITFGMTFALALAGAGSAAVVVAALGNAVRFHALAGIGGWLTFTAIGVSYRLLPMFLLAPDVERWTGRLAFGAGTVGLVIAAVAAPVETVLLGTAWAPVAALIVLPVAIVAYGVDVGHFYLRRKRRSMELNSKGALAAFGCMFAAAPFALAAPLLPMAEPHIGTIAYVLVVGWLTGLGLAQLYKIVPFLTWLECYGPLMGRRATPRVQDLVAEPRDGIAFLLFYGGVAIGTVALLAENTALFRTAAVMTLAATVWLGASLVIVRRLSRLPAQFRAIDIPMPRLFLPSGAPR